MGGTVGLEVAVGSGVAGGTTVGEGSWVKVGSGGEVATGGMVAVGDSPPPQATIESNRSKIKPDTRKYRFIGAPPFPLNAPTTLPD